MLGKLSIPCEITYPATEFPGVPARNPWSACAGTLEGNWGNSPRDCYLNEENPIPWVVQVAGGGVLADWNNCRGGSTPSCGLIAPARG